MQPWAERARWLPPIWMVFLLYATGFVAAFAALQGNNRLPLSTDVAPAVIPAAMNSFWTAQRRRRDRRLVGASTVAELLVFERAIRVVAPLPRDSMPGLRRLLAQRRRDLRRSYLVSPVVTLFVAAVPTWLAIATHNWAYLGFDILALMVFVALRVTTSNNLARLAVYDRLMRTSSDAVV